MTKYACYDCDATFDAPTDTESSRCPGCGEMVEQQPAAAASAVVSPPTDRAAEEVDADTVASRAARVITTMGADIRALTSQRDRYHTAWRSARERAQAYGEGILQHVADRDFWKTRYKAVAEQRPGLTAAALLDAADALPDADLPFVSPMGRRQTADWLRRLAAEAQQQPDTEAHPPEHAWKVESPRRDQWASWGTTYDEREWALERYESAMEHGSTRPFRLVRATTTYTVEAEYTPPAPVAQQPAAVPQRAYPDCERCGDTGIDPEQDSAPCPACQQSAAEVRHAGGNAEDCPACIADGLNKLGYPWTCPEGQQQAAAADDEETRRG
ncbi:hypothetical protein [Streptomyces sp. NPDC093060]|uniref:hypothetical protein n=1 Tax=Streptomyces sp. NPDC093060 TaxID=3366019 RepID=UPI00382E0253